MYGGGSTDRTFFPDLPKFLSRFEYAGISIPMAILIWLMIYPMMMKVDFQSIKNVGKNPKGLFVTWVVNWLIKPFSMYGIAYLFFMVIFKAFISPELATEYLAGAVLLGAAPCTAMVFVWSTLTKGNPAYTVVQVATNDCAVLVHLTAVSHKCPLILAYTLKLRSEMSLCFKADIGAAALAPVDRIRCGIEIVSVHCLTSSL